MSKMWKRFLIANLMFLGSCASSGLLIYNIEPGEDGITRNDEVIPFDDIVCVKDPVNPDKAICPYAAVSWDHMRTIIQKLAACEEGR